jgi:hypothetical protein
MHFHESNRSFWKWALAVFIASTAIVYAPVLIGRVPFPAADVFEFPLFAHSAPAGFSARDVTRLGDIGDLVTQFYPYRTITARAVRGGSLPFWNPYMLSGTSFLGNPLSALFYPLNSLYYFLPTAVAWSLGFPLRALLSCIFTALFVRRIGGSAVGAIVAALLFTFSGFVTVWQGQSMIDALIWLPLICYAIVRLHADLSRISIAILAIGFAMVALAGHPETCVHVCLLAVTLAVFMAFQSRVPVRFIGCFTFAALLGLGLAAIQLSPSVEWFLNAYRGLESTWPPAPQWSILGFVSRDLVAVDNSQNSFGLLLPNQAAYIGMMGFVAAPIAALSSSKRFAAFFALWGGVALSAAYGIGPTLTILQHTPFLKTLKHDRLAAIVIFSVAILAGLGMSAVERLDIKARTARVAAAILALSGALLATMMIYNVRRLTSAIPEVLRTPKSAEWLLLACAAIIIMRSLAGPGARWFRIAVVILVGFDVCTFAYGFVPFTKARDVYPPNELLDRLASQETAPTPFRMSQVGACFPTNIQLMYGLSESGGYEIPLARIKKFAQGLSVDDTDAVVFTLQSVLETKDRRLDMLNTKYLLVSQFDSLYEELRKYPDRFRFVDSYGDTDVYENLRAFPPAYIVPSSGIEVVPDDDRQLARIKDPGFEARRQVVLPGLPKDFVPPSSTLPVITTPSIKWTARGMNSFDMDVNASGSSVLVVSQTYYPGWKAYVDDEPVPIIRANYAFPSILVSTGPHRVRFSFEPWTFKLGLALTGLTLVILGIMVFGAALRPAQNHI